MRFLKSRSMREEFLDALMKSERVHVGVNASVWLLGEKNESALEYSEEPGGKWRVKRHGKPSGVFAERITSAKHLTLFRDPFEFIVSHEKGAASPLSGASHLVLFEEESSHRLDEILALHTHIQEIHLARSAQAEAHERENRAVHAMNQRLSPFGVQVRALPEGKAKERGRSPDFGF